MLTIWDVVSLAKFLLPKRHLMPIMCQCSRIASPQNRLGSLETQSSSCDPTTDFVKC